MHSTRRQPPGARAAAPLAAGLVLLLAAGACASSSAGGADDERLRVVASMSVIADFAREVGGDHVEVTSLVPVGADPHVHEPTPADARAVDEADLVLGNGVGLEPWFDSLVAGSDQQVITVTEELEGLVVDDEDGEPDPHLWMVPPLAAAYVERIAEELVALEPDLAEDVEAHAQRYVARLARLDDEIAETIAEVPEERRVLVTSHDAYSYFADHYDLEVATVVGVSTEEEPSAARVQRLVDLVRDAEVPTIFVETTVNPAVIRRVADDAGVEIGDPLYGDSVGEEGSGADDYVGMMRANAEALAAGLTR